MKAEDLLLALSGSRIDRDRLDALEIIVTLRKPDEIEELVSLNASLRAENELLRAQLKEEKIDRNELLGLYTRLKHAKKVFKRLGLDTSILDR